MNSRTWMCMHGHKNRGISRCPICKALKPTQPEQNVDLPLACQAENASASLGDGLSPESPSKIAHSKGGVETMNKEQVESSIKSHHALLEHAERCMYKYLQARHGHGGYHDDYSFDDNHVIARGCEPWQYGDGTSYTMPLECLWGNPVAIGEAEKAIEDAEIARRADAKREKNKRDRESEERRTFERLKAKFESTPEGTGYLATAEPTSPTPIQKKSALSVEAEGGKG